jgi:hypothetical protein
MDPYLERHSGDVHTSLVTYARDQLQKCLPKDLRARVQERVVVSQWDRPRSPFPDFRVIEMERISRRPTNGRASISVAQPLVIELADEPETQTFLEIREVSPDSRLVTVIEVLSPSTGFASAARAMLRERWLRRYRLQPSAPAAAAAGSGALGRTTPSPRRAPTLRDG